MSSETMECLKEALFAQERLFEKLYNTGREYEAIDFDESGFYEDAEERAFRHWKTLTTKIAQGLHASLDAQISVKACKNPADFSVVFTVVSVAEDGEEQRSPFRIDYSQPGQLSIFPL